MHWQLAIKLSIEFSANCNESIRLFSRYVSFIRFQLMLSFVLYTQISLSVWLNKQTKKKEDKNIRNHH